VPVAGPAGRVDALLDDDTDGAAIWHLLRSRDDGGAGGCFYICGQAGFAHTVIQALKRVIARHMPDPGGDHQAAVDATFRRMMAHGRLMLDVFTTFAPSDARSVHRFDSLARARARPAARCAAAHPTARRALPHPAARRRVALTATARWPIGQVLRAAARSRRFCRRCG